ncbi:MAG: hypothetical protein ABSE75_01720 [Acidimicrobiales bacterium]
MKRISVVPVLFIATLFLTSSTAGAISTKAAAKQYMRDVATVNVALKTFDSEINAWNNSTVDIEGEQQAASVLDALGKLRENFLNQTWPQFVKSDVRFICAEDISSLDEDLNQIDNNSSLGNGAFQFTFHEDSKVTHLHASNVRRVLGLPSSRAL